MTSPITTKRRPVPKYTPLERFTLTLYIIAAAVYIAATIWSVCKIGW